MNNDLLGLAFAAGMVAAFNPCGFAMLPAYLARIDGGEPLSASGAECGHCASRGLCRKGHWS